MVELRREAVPAILHRALLPRRSAASARSREVTQIGVELLGGTAPGDRDEVCSSGCSTTAASTTRSMVRSSAYYTEDGFEARCEALGAQKQVAGGARYADGIGWAIGLERLLLAQAHRGKR